MTKLSMSKLPPALLPTIILLAFCSGVIFAALEKNLFWQFSLSTVSLVLFAIFVLFRKKFSWALLTLAIGILFTNLFTYIASVQTAPGCYDATIGSPAKKFKQGFVYIISINDTSAAVYLPSDQFAVSDQVHLCLNHEIDLSDKDHSYILSQFRKKYVYEAADYSLRSPGHGFRRAVYNLSVKIRASADKIYFGDRGILAYGLLFGSTGDFSAQMKTDLKRSGTTHLVAVSGYNVSIITSWLFGSLRYLSKNFAGVFSVVILVLFYFLTNGSASVLRASIMGVFILIGRFIGRKIMPIHLLTLAATVIFLINPFAIYDWGFQLSFMATAGLFFLSPALEKILAFGRFKNLVKIFCETLSAQIFVLPILASNFGQFSLIGPLSNLFILPFIPLSMMLVALSLVGYFIYPLIGIFFGGLAAILLSYIMAVIRLSSSFGFSSINLKINSAVALIIGYIVIAVFTLWIRRVGAQRKAR